MELCDTEKSRRLDYLIGVLRSLDRLTPYQRMVERDRLALELDSAEMEQVDMRISVSDMISRTED